MSSLLQTEPPVLTQIPSRKACKVCNHPRSKELMAKVFSGEMTYAMAAKTLDMPMQTVWACCKNHWKELSAEEDLRLRLKDSTSVDEYIDVLKASIDIFVERLTNATQTDLPFDLQNERALAADSKEIRGLMRDILEFQGKLTTGIHVQYNILNLRFTALTSFLFSELCEIDKKKLLAKLPELIKGDEENDTRSNRTITIDPTRTS